MNCKICKAESKNIFKAHLLNKYNVKYYHCSNCGFLQTEDPYWLEEAYSSAIGIADTGILKRNIHFSKVTSVMINFLFSKGKLFLDYAGGYGIFVRLMRDIGYDFYWSDPYAQNLLARGFDYDLKLNIDAITCFECFEHLSDPLDEIDKMLAISKNILFSTRVYQDTPPNPNDWWYYSLESGQHISFYSVNTLRFLAKKYNLFLCTDSKGFHLFSERKISNGYFNFLKKLSLLGLSHLVKIKCKSLSESDLILLKGKL